MQSASCLLALVLPFLQSPAPQEGFANPVERWRAHYAAVERELLERDVTGFTPAQLATRQSLIDALGAYRVRGVFTENTDFPGARVPYFVDHQGRLCAVATLLHESGQDELVQRVARANNHVWVSELAGDADFASWLERVGLGFEEAVRIQGPGGGPDIPTAPPEPPPDGGRRPVTGPARPAGTPTPGPAGFGPATGLGGSGLGGPGMPMTPQVSLGGELEDWIQWWELNKRRWLEDELRARSRPVDDGTRAESEAGRLRRTLAPRIQAGLDHAQAEVRSAAALAYARAAGAAAVSELQELLKDPSREVRESAILALGLSDSERGVHALLSLLWSERAPTPRAKSLAIVALAVARMHGRGSGADAMLAQRLPALELAEGDDALYAALLYQNLVPTSALGTRARCASGRFREDCEHEPARSETRARALEVLRFDAEPSTVLPRLLDAVHGRSLAERRAAACSLADIPGALDPLLTAFELEEEPLTRGRLVLAIGEQGGERARGFLAQQLERGPKAQRPWAALALGLLAGEDWDGSARRVLREAQRGASKSERDALLLALGLARDEDAHGLLVQALADSRSDRTRMFAAVALGLIGAEEGRAVLVSAIPAVSCSFARSGMALALALYERAEDVPQLMGLLRAERRPESLRDLALALGLQGSLETAAGLAQMLDEDLPASVHAATLDALGLALVDDPRSILSELARSSDFTAWPGWVHDLFQRPL